MTLTRYSTSRLSLVLTVLAFVTMAPSPAAAERTVVVLFTGFGATPGGAGMDELAASLTSAFSGFPARPFTAQVFAYTELQEAFDFIDGFSDLGCLMIGGHSFGGDAAIELAESFLAPAGIDVDLLIQFDSVGVGDEVLPANVAEGINYYQVSTGLFEPQGEDFVAGSTNHQVEVLYGVTNSDISHTEIDCPLFDYTPAGYAALFGAQPDLYARIEERVEDLCVVAIPALSGGAVAVLALALLATARRMAPSPPRA